MSDPEDTARTVDPETVHVVLELVDVFLRETGVLGSVQAAQVYGALDEWLAQEREEASAEADALLKRLGVPKRHREDNPTSSVRQLQDWLSHMTSSDLPVYTKSLLAYFAGRADKEGVIRVVYSTASDEVGMSTNSYYQHIRHALASGLITKHGEFSYSRLDRKLTADAYSMKVPERPP